MNQKIYRNPITDVIINSLENSQNELLIAVPFIRSFAKSILTEERLARFKIKRILTRFDESDINTFDLHTFKYFLDNDVELRFNNKIHLKLYLFDNQGFISSSNLTRSGFESSIEITNSIENDAIRECKDFFEKLWSDSSDRIVTQQLIEENYPKYRLLKRNSNSKKKKKSSIQYNDLKIPNFNQKLINHLLNTNLDYIYRKEKVIEANKIREKFRVQLKQGFNINDFCRSEEGDNNSLSYALIYVEKKLAASGLLINEVEKVFRNKSFVEIIEYIYPPIIGNPDWNLDDSQEFRNYCNGIFDFKVPYYKSTLPIRLASYFYPQHFLPIFKLEDLEDFCRYFGCNFNVESKGDKLYIYNNFLQDKMKHLPYDNYYKSNILYLLQYIIYLNNELQQKSNYNEICNNAKNGWKSDYIKYAKNILDELNKKSST